MPTIDTPAPWIRSTPGGGRLAGVPYHFLMKITESFAHDTNMSTAWIECVFDDAGLLKQDIFGSARYVGGSPRLVRSLPLVSGYYSTHFLQRMDFEGFQGERPTATYIGSDPDTGFPAVDGYAQYRLTFGNVPYSVLSDEAVDALAATQNGVSANSCVPEMFRFLRVTRRYLPESRKVPTMGFEVYDEVAGAGHPAFTAFPVLEVGSIPTFQIEILAETILWPAANFPDGGVQACLGTVNNAAISINGNLYPAGTLLYKGPAAELTPYRWIDGKLYFDVPHLFGFRTQGWNMHRLNAPIAADGNRQWYPIRAKGVAGNQPMFQNEDHTKIFKPEPTH